MEAITSIGPKTDKSIFKTLENLGIANGVTIIKILGKVWGINWILGIGSVRNIADVHDLLFWIGGDEKDFHRDNKVLRDAIIEKGYRKAKRYWQPFRWFLRYRTRKIANTFFDFVEDLGWSHFHWGPKRCVLTPEQEAHLVELAIAD